MDDFELLMDEHDFESPMDRYERETLEAEEARRKEEEGSPGPNDVVFTQYLRPSGEQRLVWATMTPEVKAKADALVAAGFRFECEQLQDGRVYMDCCNPEFQLANCVTQEGPSIPVKVEEIILRAHEKWTTGNYPKEEPF